MGRVQIKYDCDAIVSDEAGNKIKKLHDDVAATIEKLIEADKSPKAEPKEEGFEPVGSYWWRVQVDSERFISYPIIISLIEPFSGDGSNGPNAIKFPHRIFGVDHAKQLIKDIQSALAYVENPPQKKEEVFYKVGQRFKDEEGDKYLLVQAMAGRVALVVYEGDDVGNRNCDPVCVKNTRRITESEFAKICGGSTFTLIE